MSRSRFRPRYVFLSNCLRFHIRYDRNYPLQTNPPCAEPSEILNSFFLPERTAGNISDFVRNGGCVLMRQGTAVYDYRGNTFTRAPGWGLDELFRTHPKQALLTATDIGEQFENAPEAQRANTAITLWNLLGQYGILPPFHCYQPGIEVHLREKDKAAYLVLINHNEEPGNLRLTMKQTGGTACDLETLENSS